GSAFRWGGNGRECCAPAFPVTESAVPRPERHAEFEQPFGHELPASIGERARSSDRRARPEALAEFAFLSPPAASARSTLTAVPHRRSICRASGLCGSSSIAESSPVNHRGRARARTQARDAISDCGWPRFRSLQLPPATASPALWIADCVLLCAQTR